MPPGALLGVIPRRQHLLALGARPGGLHVFRPEIHALFGRIQLDPGNAPGRLQPQNRFEEFLVLHRSSRPGFYRTRPGSRNQAAEQAPHPTAGPAQAAVARC